MFPNTESERGTIKSVVNPQRAWAAGGVMLLIVVDRIVIETVTLSHLNKITDNVLDWMIWTQLEKFQNHNYVRLKYGSVAQI